MRIILNFRSILVTISRFTFAISILAAAMLIGPSLGRTDSEQTPPEIRFENHQFKPASLSVPTGQKLTLRVVNASNETIEFESFKLNREKVVSPGQTITVGLPALSAGNYDFYDDFHQDVPQGSIVAK
jgi:plastocyanin